MYHHFFDKVFFNYYPINILHKLQRNSCSKIKNINSSMKQYYRIWQKHVSSWEWICETVYYYIIIYYRLYSFSIWTTVYLLPPFQWAQTLPCRRAIIGIHNSNYLEILKKKCVTFMEIFRISPSPSPLVCMWNNVKFFSDD